MGVHIAAWALGLGIYSFISIIRQVFPRRPWRGGFDTGACFDDGGYVGYTDDHRP
jgi:hypothetical protein